MNSRAAHVRTLTVPVLAAPRRSSPARGVLSALRRDKSADGPADGCDPAVFAEQVAEYLERATAERAAHDAAAERHARAAVVDAFPTTTHAEPVVAAFDPDPYVASAQPAAADAIAIDEWTAPEPEMAPVVESPIVAAPVAAAAELPAADAEPDSFAAAVAEPDPFVASVAQPEPVPVADPYVATVADPYVATVSDPPVAAPEPVAQTVTAPEAPADAVLPVLEFLVSHDEATLDLQASLDALDVVDVAEPVQGLTDDGFEGFDPQMLSALLPDAYPVLEVVSDELDAAEEAEAAGDEIDLGALLDEPRAPRTAAAAFEPAGAAAIMAAVAAVERSMAGPPPGEARTGTNAWVPLRFESRQQWPRMEGVEAEPPAPGTPIDDPAPADAASVDLDVRPPTPLKKKKAKSKPAQDEWGLFDPAQCGFAALLAKLEEITEKEDARSA